MLKKIKQKKMKKLKQKVKYVLYFVILLTILISYPVAYYISSENITITVKDKERITTGSGENISSKFIIYTENEVFENCDTWLFLKFNSSDFQNKFEKGKTYNVNVAGWRIPFFSTYRNIVDFNNK